MQPSISCVIDASPARRLFLQGILITSPASWLRKTHLERIPSPDWLSRSQAANRSSSLSRSPESKYTNNRGSHSVINCRSKHPGCRSIKSLTFTCVSQTENLETCQRKKRVIQLKLHMMVISRNLQKNRMCWCPALTGRWRTEWTLHFGLSYSRYTQHTAYIS